MKFYLVFIVSILFSLPALSNVNPEQLGNRIYYLINPTLRKDIPQVDQYPKSELFKLNDPKKFFLGLYYGGIFTNTPVQNKSLAIDLFRSIDHKKWEGGSSLLQAYLTQETNYADIVQFDRFRFGMKFFNNQLAKALYADGYQDKKQYLSLLAIFATNEIVHFVKIKDFLMKLFHEDKMTASLMRKLGQAMVNGAQNDPFIQSTILQKSIGIKLQIESFKVCKTDLCKDKRKKLIDKSKHLRHRSPNSSEMQLISLIKRKGWDKNQFTKKRMKKKFSKWYSKGENQKRFNSLVTQTQFWKAYHEMNSNQQ